MNFRCLGDAVDPEPYLLQQHYSSPQDEISNLRRILREKNLKCNKLQIANDKLRRRNEHLKSNKQTLTATNNSLTSIQREHDSELHKLANQTRIKIKELHNENQHVQECYNKLKHKNNENENTINQLTNEINQFKNVISRKDDTIKALLPYREQCKLLIIKLDEMNKIYKQNEVLYKKQISLLKDDSSCKLQQIHTNKSHIKLLTNDLSNAKQDLLNYIGSEHKTDSNNNLPSIQETLWMYNDIRDQIYTQTNTVLKEFMTREYDGSHNRWYINQICHELLFNILIQTFVVTKTYKQKLFDNICKILNVNNDNNDNNDNIHLLHKLLSNYLKINYNNNSLLFDEIKIEIMGALKENCNGYYHKEIALNIFNLSSNNKEIIAIKRYIHKCVKICWIMVLSDLKFYPSFWRVHQIKGNNNQFNEEIHERVLGANVKCKKVLYYVWPLIIINNNIIGKQKIEILTRNHFYKPNNKINDTKINDTKINDTKINETKIN